MSFLNKISNKVTGLPNSSSNTDERREQLSDTWAMIWWRNAWNMDISSKIAAALSMSLAANLFLVGIVGYRYVNPVPPRFIAVTPDNRLIPLTPYSTPMESDAQILRYANKLIIDCYSFNFMNWRDQLQRRMRPNFQHKAWAEWFGSLVNNGVIETMIKNKQTISAVTHGVPVITAEGDVDGRWAWRIQIPVKINYDAGNPNSKTHNYIATVVLIRANVVSHPMGVKIVQFLLQNAP